MKLSTKIISPSLIIVTLFAVVFVYLLVVIERQERFLLQTSKTIEQTAIFSAQLNVLQEKTARSLLSYRFSQEQRYLDIISRADTETARIIDHLAQITLPGLGQDFLRAFAESHQGIDAAQRDLLTEIRGSTEELSGAVSEDADIVVAFDRWNTLSEKSLAALEDLVVFNTRELNRSIEIIGEQRQVVRTILFGSIALAAVLVVFSVFFYQRVVVSPLRELTRAADKAAQQKEVSVLSIPSKMLADGSEVGMLARAFKTMTEKLQDAQKNLEQKIEKRTQELEDTKKQVEGKLAETEKLNSVMVGRELKMVELKKEIEKLKSTQSSTMEAKENST